MRSVRNLRKETLTALTETAVQDALSIEMEARGHGLIVPNTTLYSWEADLITVTKAGRVYEYEIKVDKHDYRNELKAAKEMPRGSICKWIRHMVLRQAQETGQVHPRHGCPNYFWFVVPMHFVDEMGSLDYAGLIVPKVGDSGRIHLTTARKAPKLHSDKISDGQRHKLSMGLHYRYWRMRREKNSRVETNG